MTRKRSTPPREATTEPVEQPLTPEFVYSREPIQRIRMVKEGVPADFLVDLARAMGIPRQRLYDTIGVSRPTIDRKVRGKQRLNVDESERALGVAQLIGQVERIVRESGDPEGFDAAQWVAEWLDDPCPALGGERPAEFMDTADGRAIVKQLVGAMQSGAYV